MKKIIVLLFWLCSASVFCSEVRVDVNAQVSPRKNYRCEVTLIIDIINESKQSIWLSELAGQLADCEVELWFSGQGVRLRPPKDAEWRRAQAFTASGRKELKSGEKRRCVFKLKELMPTDPDRDKFAQSLQEGIESMGFGDGRIEINFKSYDDSGKPKYDSILGKFKIKEENPKDKPDEKSVEKIN